MSTKFLEEPMCCRSPYSRGRELFRRDIFLAGKSCSGVNKCSRIAGLMRVQKTQIKIDYQKQEIPTLSTWYDIVETFTNYDITYESDSLPAISGVARIIGRAIGYGYCAGIWTNRVSSSLLWAPRRNGPKKVARESYVAPSFSLASSKGPVWYRATSKSDSGSLCSCADHSQINVDGSNDMYGAIKSGWLALKGPVILATPVMQTANGSSTNVLELRLEDGEKFLIPVQYDHDLIDGPPKDIFALPMYAAQRRLHAIVVTHTTKI
jgi:hypothetical protein